jgi:hypothetical protein
VEAKFAFQSGPGTHILFPFVLTGHKFASYELELPKREGERERQICHCYPSPAYLPSIGMSACKEAVINYFTGVRRLISNLK